MNLSRERLLDEAAALSRFALRSSRRSRGCCRCSRRFPFTEAEREFLDRVLDQGEIRAELLTADEALAGRIAQHPSLAWKAQNVRKHFGR